LLARWGTSGYPFGENGGDLTPALLIDYLQAQTAAFKQALRSSEGGGATQPTAGRAAG